MPLGLPLRFGKVAGAKVGRKDGFTTGNPGTESPVDSPKD